MVKGKCSLTSAFMASAPGMAPAAEIFDGGIVSVLDTLKGRNTRERRGEGGRRNKSGGSDIPPTERDEAPTKAAACTAARGQK